MSTEFDSSLESINRRYSAERSELYRADGLPIWADDIHAEKLQAIDAKERGELQSLAKRIDEAESRLQAEKITVGGASPLDRLTTGELQRAAALLPFLQAEIGGMSLQALALRCEAAASGNDKALLLALSQAVPVRLANREPLPGPSQQDALKRVQNALGQMGATLAGPGNNDRLKALHANGLELERVKFAARKAMAKIAPPPVPVKDPAEYAIRL